MCFLASRPVDCLLRNEEAVTSANVKGAATTLKNLREQLHMLDRRAQQQHELLYNAEFQMQQLERKIGHTRGERYKQRVSRQLTNTQRF